MSRAIIGVNPGAMLGVSREDQARILAAPIASNTRHWEPHERLAIKEHIPFCFGCGEDKHACTCNDLYSGE